MGKLPKNFKFGLQELVCKHVYLNYSHDQILMFLDKRLIETLHVIREDILGVPMIINNWHQGGIYSQRGGRCNMCDLVAEKKRPYLSAHVLFKAIDFIAQGYTAEQARSKIISNKHLLPYPIRLELGCSWVHFDLYDDLNTEEKITFFAG